MSVHKYIFLGGLVFSIYNLYGNLNILYTDNKYSNDVYQISISRSTLNHNAYLILKQDNRALDSLLLTNMDFRTDSLININNKYWNYFYSTCIECDPGVKTSVIQIILTIKNKKLKIAYISEYLYITAKPDIDFNECHTTDVIIKNNFKLYHKKSILLDTANFANNYLTERCFCRDCYGLTFANGIVTRSYPILYDKFDGIFYNKKIKFNGRYKFEAEVNGIRTEYIFHNKFLPIIPFYDVTLVYIDEKWFILVGKTFRPIEILSSYCNGKCY
jgi:hypothetical protein